MLLLGVLLNLALWLPIPLLHFSLKWMGQRPKGDPGYYYVPLEKLWAPTLGDAVFLSAADGVVASAVIRVGFDLWMAGALVVGIIAGAWWVKDATDSAWISTDHAGNPKSSQWAIGIGPTGKLKPLAEGWWHSLYWGVQFAILYLALGVFWRMSLAEVVVGVLAATLYGLCFLRDYKAGHWERPGKKAVQH